MDAVLLEQVLWHIHNWFPRETVKGSCSIVGGSLPASFEDEMLEGQWYRIEGRYLNDGLHQHPADDLEDEDFDATITLLSIPKALLNLVEEIEEWVDDNAEADRAARKGVYQSESFGGYTYTRRADTRSQSGSGTSPSLTGWKAAFAADLNAWRKIS